MALAVAKAESGLNTNAIHKNYNGTTDFGIFQVNSIHSQKVNGNLNSLFDPETNIRIAKQIRDGSGWGAWVAYRNKKYLLYLEK